MSCERDHPIEFPQRAAQRPLAARTRAFTIIELLVVIGVIAILAALTTLGARRLTNSSRLAGGTNAVTNALGVARAAAIRDSLPTALVFRPVWDSTKKNVPQRVEMVVVRWTGAQFPYFADNNVDIIGYKHPYRPVANVPAIVLPEGIKVAGPMYQNPAPGVAVDPSGSFLVTQAELPQMENCAEAANFNRQIAVLFGPNGEFLTRPPGATLLDAMMFVDWNNDAALATPNDPNNPNDDPTEEQDATQGTCANLSSNYQKFWFQDHPNDENNILLVPFLVVYDDKAARELKGLDWSSEDNMFDELNGPSGYIRQFGDRITFNRFSGIPERKVR
jgi:prepilin-type N-terminal cleavage/methylation domain-containing protein